MKYNRALDKLIQRVRQVAKAQMKIHKALVEDKHEALDKVKRSVKQNQEKCQTNSNKALDNLALNEVNKTLNIFKLKFG